jgi:hypothetical protein
MKTNNTFNGKFIYTYKKTGYNEQDFKKVYDAHTRSIDCLLKLPNENDKCVIEMHFVTPDDKYNGFVSSDLKSIVINGSDLLYLGIHFKEYIKRNDIVIINGDFILEIKEETDGFHVFDFSIEIENQEIINEIENQKLIVKNNI